MVGVWGNVVGRLGLSPGQGVLGPQGAGVAAQDLRPGGLGARGLGAAAQDPSPGGLGPRGFGMAAQDPSPGVLGSRGFRPHGLPSLGALVWPCKFPPWGVAPWASRGRTVSQGLGPLGLGAAPQDPSLGGSGPWGL